MFAKIHTLIENTPRGLAMPDGTGTFAVWAINRFPAYDRPKYYCKRGSPNLHITLWVVFYAIGICLLLYRPINRSIILTVHRRRKINIVSHLLVLPVSVWSIVLRETILPPAELIPLPEVRGKLIIPLQPST